MLKSPGWAVILLAHSWLLLAPAEAWSQKKQRDVITREEILNSAQRNQDIFQVIRSLRPHFLAPPRGVRSLGSAPPAPVALYLNGTRLGDLSNLRTLVAIEVEEVRYLDASRAENEYGISHSGGAVLVKLVKAAKLDRKPPP